MGVALHYYFGLPFPKILGTLLEGIALSIKYSSDPLGTKDVIVTGNIMCNIMATHCYKIPYSA